MKGKSSPPQFGTLHCPRHRSLHGTRCIIICPETLVRFGDELRIRVVVTIPDPEDMRGVLFFLPPGQVQIPESVSPKRAKTSLRHAMAEV